MSSSTPDRQDRPDDEVIRKLAYELARTRATLAAVRDRLEAASTGPYLPSSERLALMAYPTADEIAAHMPANLDFYDN